MRATLFLNERSTITADLDTLTLDIAEREPGVLGELTIHLGSRPAVVAVVTDVLIDRLIAVRDLAVRRSLTGEGTATFSKRILANTRLLAHGEPDGGPGDVIHLKVAIDEMPSFWAAVQLDEQGYIPRWNGFVAAPLFSRTETQRIIDWITADEDAMTQIVWDGDAVVITRDDFDYEPERIEKSVLDGIDRWSIGAYSWTWYAAPERDLALLKEEVDDRPGADFVPCTDATHVNGCPGGAGGDHIRLDGRTDDAPEGAGGVAIEVERG